MADAIPRRCLPVDWQSHTEPERSGGGGGEGTAATIREVAGQARKYNGGQICRLTSKTRFYKLPAAAKVFLGLK